MPIKTGVQAVQAIRTFYENVRCDYSEAADLQDPEYIILTAFKTPNFEAHLKSQGISQCYEKPMELEHFSTILVQASMD